MEVQVRWIADAAFAGVSGTGHRLLIDGPAEGGGRDLGPRPMELLLLGMAACSAYDVLMILRKGRLQVGGCEVEVKAERADDHPRVFTRIHLHFVLYGKALGVAQVQRAIDLSAEKYCSASIMLGKAASLSHDYELRDG